MYCPNCGQQQVSDEMRYCSRCGLLLSGLIEWLAGGRLPFKPVDEVGQVPVPMSPRRKAMRRAAKLMFFSGVLFPIFLVFSLAFEEGAPMVIPFGLFFIALVWMLYARLFMDKAVPVHNLAAGAQTSALGSTSARGSLPAATNMPGPGIGRRQTRTNELAQPSSVTEHTTRLLDNE
jgi:hypothetical protein